jgi:hypothetical protein
MNPKIPARATEQSNYFAHAQSPHRKHASAQINSNGMGAVEQSLSESISVATVDDEILLRKKSDRYL